MTANLHTTQINLSGLLEVLGKNLYSTPTVVVRELIQNAHDACLRRSIEAPGDHKFKIRIETNAAKKQLTISDNGAGLTDREIVDYLATIGSGYTRLLRQQTHSNSMIGFFGLGFLTAYVVSQKVEMWTTSYKETSRGWHFISSAGKTYSIEPCEQQPVGSKVVLHLADEFSELTDSQLLEELLRQYCCLLPIDIYVNRQQEPINNITIPWRHAQEVSPLRLKKQYFELAQIFEHRFEPLCTIPLTKDDEGKLNGILWIQDASTYGSNDNRNVTVFVRNMYITNQARELLPDWAGFAGCVIESIDLTPTASREDIQKDREFEKVQSLIREALISGLKQLAEKEPATWRRILSRHNEALLGAAVSEERLFSVLAGELKLPTTDDDLTISEILNRSSGKIHVSLEDKAGFEEVLCKSLKIPIVKGFRYAALPFCKTYVQENNGELVLLGTKDGNKALFKEETIPVEHEAILRELLISANEKLIPSRFQPHSLPIVMIVDEDALLKKRIEADDADKRISTAALGLARLYTKNLSDEIQAYVYVNMNSILVEKLFTLTADKRTHLGKMLRSFTLIVGGGEGQPNSGSLAHQLDSFNQSVLALLEGAD